MKISTKGRYALRLMMDLALHAQEEPVRIKEIGKRQEISVKYLEQIVSVLQKAGYVKSIRGPHGGYFLAKPSKEYTVGMILRLTEGDLSPVACLKQEEACTRQEYCVIQRIYRELDEAIKGVVDQYTLEDLVNWSRTTAYDYSI